MHYVKSSLDNPFVFQGGDEEHKEGMRGAHWPRQQGLAALTMQCQLPRAGYSKPIQGVSVED